MSENNKRTYIYNTEIKPYRKKRLFYSPHFRKLYFEIDSQVTLCQRECQLCTHMWLQRFREDEIVVVMTWWYAHHRIEQPNWWRLRNFVLPKTKKFAQPLVKQQRQEEYARRKERQQQKKLELERQQLQPQQKGEEINGRSN